MTDGRLRMAAALVLLGTAATACSSTQAGDVREVTRTFYRSVDGGDGAAACRQLAPRTRSELEKSAQQACPEAILDEDLPSVAGVRDVQVYGTTALVGFGDETTFLARFQDGWKVMAAGCKPQKPAQPYDCQLSGG